VLLMTLSFANPWVFNWIRQSPLPLMLSHYSLFSAGGVLGYTRIRKGKAEGLAGVLPAILWHLPEAFALSGSTPFFTVVDLSTMFLGGLLIGASVRWMRDKLKVSLLVLWMASDTALSVLFLISSPIYSKEEIPFSPYVPQQFFAVGVVMIGIMNVVLIVILYYFFRKVVNL